MSAAEEGREDNGVRTIEVEEDVEGEHVGSTDYYFDRIGKPIPILSNASCPLFQTQSPPSSPLAVSDYHGLLFLAHPSGFLVARTKDVMDAAKGMASSVQDYCVADVPIGNVHILAISSPSSSSTSALAVSVAGHVHFFSIDSILNEDLEPFSTCSLSNSSVVKDFQWRRRISDNSYLLLSNDAKLYHGAVGTPLNHALDHVDAAEWSPEGKFIAVARKNNIIICSSKFKENSCIPLPFKSWIGDSDDSCTVTVDSIRWVCQDSIVVGCLQQTADGKEENYLLQVVRGKNGKITDASSKPVVLSFFDLFLGLMDDILPYGSGPYLFLSYLQQCGLAVVANRKNTDQHIVLLRWSMDEDTNAPTAVDIERDTWLPRIELQGNGDDNLIMGLCIDNISLYGKVKIEVGSEEQRELSPYCVLMCVTLEGKLVMFHLASVKEPDVLPDVDSAPCDEEEDVTAEAPVEKHSTNLSMKSGGQTLKQVDVVLEVGKEETSISRTSEISVDKSVLSSGSKSPTTTLVAQKTSQGVISNNQNIETPGNLSLVYDVQQNFPLTQLPGGFGDQQLQPFGLQSAMLRQSSLKTSHHDGSSHAAKDTIKTETHKYSGFHTSSLDRFAADAPSLSSDNNLPKSAEPAKQLPGRTVSTVLSPALSPSWSGGKVTVSKGFEKSSLLSSTSIQGSKSESDSVKPGATNIQSNLSAISPLMNAAGGSGSLNFPVKSERQSASIRPGTFESLPSIRNSQPPSQETLAFERSLNQRPSSSKDEFKSTSISQPNLSKQPSNVKEMAKELDTLLRCIEEPGGFRDSCTVSLRGSIEALEEGMGAVSEKCRMWKSLMDVRFEEIQHLLDKTVQVMARKIYMDSIVKQASDSQYWEFWNRQKLSSELELKQQYILKLNQELTDQLIQLERHFNTLELHRFGESWGHTGRRALEGRHAPSRCTQSLHSLHNAMTSQLSAAEQLSESLAKQMAMLNIESPIKRKSIKKELFETIGLPYEATFSTPDATKVSNTSSLKKLMFSSGSAGAKDQSRSRQSSAMKSSDSETGRRKRDSLDQSWTNFEPTRTTVRRVLLHENTKTGLKKSSLMDGLGIGSSLLGRPEALRFEDQTSPSTFLYPSGNQDIKFGLPKQTIEKKLPFEHANDVPPPSQPMGLRSPITQNNNVLSYQALPMAAQNHGRDVTAGKSHGRVSYRENSDSGLNAASKAMEQNQSSLHKTSAVSPTFTIQTESLLKKPSEMTDSDIKGTQLPTSNIEIGKHVPASAKSISFEASSKKPDSLFPPMFPQFNKAATMNQSGEFNKAATMNQSGEKPLSSSSFSVSLSMSSSSASSFTTNSNQAVSSSSLSSVSPIFPFGSSVQAAKMLSPTPGLPVAESPKEELQSQNAQHISSMNQTLPISQSESPSTELSTGKTPVDSTSVHSTSVFSKVEQLQPPVSEALPVSMTPKLSAYTQIKSEPPATEVISTTDVIAATSSPPSQSKPFEFSLKYEPSASSIPATPISNGLGSGSQSSLNNRTSLAPNVATHAQPQQSSSVHSLFGASLSSSLSVTGMKNENLDANATEEDEMEEEAPESNHGNELSLGSLGGFGIGSTPGPTAPKANPFGGSFSNIATSQPSSSFSSAMPTGELFRPASFNFQSLSPSQPSPPSNLGALDGGFGAGMATQPPAQTQFGRPAQVGQGQQALGSVLGSFGQSRQLGAGLPGSGSASVTGFGGGFANTSATGGFSNAPSSGGFAGVASGSGGFASLAGGGFGGGGFGAVPSHGGGFGSVTPAGGGFAGAASAGGGFAGAASVGGFAGAPSAGGGFTGAYAGGGFPTAGRGFGAFGSQQAGGGGGFSTFGGQQGTVGFSGFGGNAGGGQQAQSGFSAFGSGGTGKPPQLFTEMRR